MEFVLAGVEFVEEAELLAIDDRYPLSLLMLMIFRNAVEVVPRRHCWAFSIKNFMLLLF